MTFRRLSAIACIVLSLTACQTPVTQDVPAASNADLDAFLDAAFEARLARSPQLQTRLGIKTDYGKWNAQTEEAYAAAHAEEQKHLSELRRLFDPESLDKKGRLNYELFEYDTKRRISSYAWRRHDYAIDHRSGVHTRAPSFLINSHSVADVSDARNYIERVRGLAPLFDQTIGQMRMAAAAGVIPPTLIFDAAIEGAGNVITGAPFDDGPDTSLRADFKTKLNGLSLKPAEQADLLSQLDAALLTEAKPAYERLINALKLLRQRATTNGGVWSLPDGARYYDYKLGVHTSTELTATEVHDIGLAEVARIHDEMRAIMREVGFEGTLGEFFDFTRTDSQFYYADDAAGRERYLSEARAWIDKMRERLPELFTVFPRTDLVVRRVEPFRESSAGKAFYMRPSADGSRPGVYYANLYRMNRMPIYQMQALAYHEGIPGHHMQIAIQQELEDLPRFRKFGTVTAFVEGWGLYSEWLPTEIDAYSDPYSDFGRLAMELWRACRLVVDTGMHAKRWTRAEGIAYLLENTPNPEGDAINAIERYLVNPGQATAYKIGMLKIMELRAMAEAELGEQFDVRRFHDAVLANGPLPLAILEAEIERFIAAELGR